MDQCIVGNCILEESRTILHMLRLRTDVLAGAGGVRANFLLVLRQLATHCVKLSRFKTEETKSNKYNHSISSIPCPVIKSSRQESLKL